MEMERMASIDVFPVKPIIHKEGYLCPRCVSYNDVWKKRESTIRGDIVYCWHCGCKVRLN